MLDRRTEGSGTDAGRLEDALVEYYSLIDGGWRPVKEEFLSRYPEIAGEIEKLFANETIVLPGPPVTTSLEVGRIFGDYEIRGEIGRGGMGVVYRAWQRTLGRLVALKLILSGGFASDVERQRFRREAQAAASLDHPNIVPVYEVGEEEGLPFLAMKLIEGKSLADGRLQAEREPRAAAEVVEKVALALVHAHERGIIHRDVKPENILLGHDGVPYIMDFGLARIGGASADLTRTGSVLGTLCYMAPEQARGNTTLDCRVDVYGLGAVLYHALVGHPPFQGTAPADLLGEVLEREPVSPSACIPGLPRDLVTICMRCLEKDPSHRYPTAQALADDLRRFIEDRPIQARRPSTAERMAKWGRRHRKAVLSAVCVGMAALIGLGASTLLLSRAYRREASERATATNERDAARYNLYLADMRVAQRDWEAGQLGRMHQTLEHHLPEEGEKDLRGWEWYYLLSLCHQEYRWLQAPGRPESISWSPDGGRVASIEGPALRIWDVQKGKEALMVRDPSLLTLAWSPDGERIAAVSAKNGVKLLDAGTGKCLFKVSCGFSSRERIPHIAWSPAADRLAVTAGGGVKVLDANSGEELMSIRHANFILKGAWSPDGRWLATGETFGRVKICDARTGIARASWQAHPLDLFDLAWSPESDRIATVSYQDGLKIWEAMSGSQLLSIPSQSGIDAVAWTPGRSIAVGNRAQKVLIFDPLTGRETEQFSGHLGWVLDIAWSPDGTLLASAAEAIRIWKVGRESVERRPLPWEGVDWAWWAPGGRLLASFGRRTLRGLDPSGSQVTEDEIFEHQGPTIWSPDGRRAAVESSKTGKLEVWEIDSGAVGSTRNRLGSIPIEWSHAVAWNSNGSKLAGARGGSVKIWDAVTGKEVSGLEGHTKNIFSIRWSPDGSRIATGAFDGLVKIWEASSGQEAFTLRGTVRGDGLVLLPGVRMEPFGVRRLG
jgi:WD40 repeat protein/predicted Ser/Thr protein kinase